VEPGDAVSPGRALLDLAFEGPVELTVFPSEESLPFLQVGGRATGSADAFPDSVFDATVALVAPSIDPGQGTVEVRLTVPAPPSYLLPDMTVSVNVEAGRKAEAAVLPEAAVRGLGTATPWVAIVRHGRVERAEVAVGLRAPGFVEILDGVGAGDRVVSTADVEVGEPVRDRGEPTP
jgi:HlyD family secretion protein